MFNLLFDNTSLPVLQQVLSFSEQRNKVLAENVANVNTPGFRQTDLAVDEFTAELGRAIERQERSTVRPFEMDATRHIDVGPRGGLRARPVAIRGLQNFYDAGNRSVERLMSEMSKNSLWHRMAVDLYVQQSNLLETAIRERVS